MNDIVREGLMLAVYGMGTVFFFLTFLVGATVVMSKLALALEPASTADSSTASRPATGNNRRLAAITAAIHQYRRDHELR